MSNRTNFQAFLMVVAAMTVTVTVASAQTSGEHFRQRYENLKRDCERNPPARGDARCNLLKVQIEDPMATPEGRFAHSIAIPDPMPANAGYRPDMSATEYFEYLCKHYAGEFIYKTAENVEGLLQLRLREPASSYKFEHLYAMEDPYGHMQEEAEEPGFQFVGQPYKYAFYEQPISPVRPLMSLRDFRHPSIFARPPEGAKIERYFGYRGNRNSLQLEFDTRARARYALTWRGILRPGDRDLGIAGGEVIVLDTERNEVLGVRRGFALYRGSWEATRLCPKYGYFGGFDKATGFTSWFTLKVARSPKWKEYFELNEPTRIPRGSRK